MTAEISLNEWDSWQGRLAPEDVTFIARDLARQFRIVRSLVADTYTLTTNSHVGVVRLPSGIRLEVRPKVPAANLFYMLAVALDLGNPFRPELEQVDELDEVLAFLAEYYAELVDQHIDAGLYRTYVEREENLASVRGRISFAEDVRHNHVLRHRTYCAYADFTWDVPENRILRQVAHLLSGWPFPRELRIRLGQLDTTLSELTPSRFAASIVDTFTYHRFNESYQKLHGLCRLFLEASSLSEHRGQFEFQTFLLDMNLLFESFVTETLRREAGQRTEVVGQASLHLGTEKRIPMRPDILVRRDGAVALVADCKYKRTEFGDLNHDWYQALAYCIAADVRDGVLIYPGSDPPVEANGPVPIRNTEIVIRRAEMNLGLPLAAFREESRRLACEVFDARTTH